MKLMIIAVLIGAIAGVIGGVGLAFVFPDAPVETAGVIGAVAGACIGIIAGTRATARNS